MLGFVHVTKTGGTAVQEHFEANCPRLIEGKGHSATERTHEGLGRPVFVVLREPHDRFLSQYHYWRDGATQGANVHPLMQIAENRRLFPTAASLVDGALQRTWFSKAVLNMRTSQFVWGAHFQPQTHWLDGEHRNTWVVCYSAATLATRVGELLRHLGVPCDAQRIPPTNPTVAYDRATSHFNRTHLRWIESRYRSDVALWGALCAGSGGRTGPSFARVPPRAGHG